MPITWRVFVYHSSSWSNVGAWTRLQCCGKIQAIACSLECERTWNSLTKSSNQIENQKIEETDEETESEHMSAESQQRLEWVSERSREIERVGRRDDRWGMSCRRKLKTCIPYCRKYVDICFVRSLFVQSRWLIVSSQYSRLNSVVKIKYEEKSHVLSR